MHAGAIVSDEIFVDLHWLKVEERIVFQLLLFVHKFFVDNTPSYFAELLLVRDYSKRLLYCCFMNTVPGRRAFFYATPRLWNELPEVVRLQDNTEKFKNMIKLYYSGTLTILCRLYSTKILQIICAVFTTSQYTLLVQNTSQFVFCTVTT